MERHGGCNYIGVYKLLYTDATKVYFDDAMAICAIRKQDFYLTRVDGRPFFYRKTISREIGTCPLILNT